MGLSFSVIFHIILLIPLVGHRSGVSVGYWYCNGVILFAVNAGEHTLLPQPGAALALIDKRENFYQIKA